MTPEFTCHPPINRSLVLCAPPAILAAAAGALLLSLPSLPGFAQTPTLLVLRAVPAQRGRRRRDSRCPAAAHQADISQSRWAKRSRP